MVFQIIAGELNSSFNVDSLAAIYYRLASFFNLVLWSLEADRRIRLS